MTYRDNPAAWTIPYSALADHARSVMRRLVTAGDYSPVAIAGIPGIPDSLTALRASDVAAPFTVMMTLEVGMPYPSFSARIRDGLANAPVFPTRPA